MDFKSPIGVNSRTDMNLNHSHVLTHNFGVMSCLSWMPMVPGDKFDINLNSFTRLLPLPCPTFGGIKMIKRAFFVPTEFVMRGFSDFLDGKKYSSSGGLKNYSVPYTKIEDVVSVIINDSTLSTAVTTGAYDYDVAGTHYRLTSKGRKIRSWLHTIGIKTPRVIFDLSTGTVTNKQTYNFQTVDLLKLLSWWKFYLDWVVPARFVSTTPSFVIIKKVLDDTFYAGHSYFDVFGAAEGLNLTDLISYVPVSFLEDDFYTSAFITAYGPETADNPISGMEVPFSGVASSPTLSNPDLNNSFDRMPTINSGNTSGNRYLSQVQLLSLGRLQDFVNTRKITDQNVLRWLKLTYGIAPSKDALRYSQYLGAQSSVIQIGDVMATATTENTFGNTYVGQFAGKGLGADKAHWKFDTDKHGILFVTCEIQTNTSYVNGLSPLCQMLTRESFYNPRFDNVGTRAISHRELVFDTFDTAISSDSTPDSQIPNADSIFGFAPRYSEFKHIDDIVSGDFICPSVNSGLDSWYLSRQFVFESDPKISLDFCSAASDTVGSAYDRIFQNTNNDDHFYSVFNIGVKASRPMESVSDYFETIDSEHNKKSIPMDNNSSI